MSGARSVRARLVKFVCTVHNMVNFVYDVVHNI